LAATAVLVLHGFTAQPKTVDHIAGFLEKASLPFEIPTLRGHAQTPEALIGVRWQDWLEDAQNAYERLEKAHGRVAVVGHSMGGLVAGLLAARKPQMESLVLVAPALEFSNPTARFAPLLKRVMKWSNAGEPSMYDPKLRAEAEAGMVTYKRFPVAAFAELYALAGLAPREFGRVTCPAIVIHSRKDQVIPPSAGEKAFAHLGSRDKKLTWFERSGHEMFWDMQRDQLSQTIVDFVKSKMPVSNA
jgi:carboxylesterase